MIRLSAIAEAAPAAAGRRIAAVRIAKLRNGLERHLTLTGFEPVFVRIDPGPDLTGAAPNRFIGTGGARLSLSSAK
jgi:hypothetical protein